MNKIYALSFLILTLSCSSGKNSETAVDSTQNVMDTVNVSASPSIVTPTNYSPEPARNFPSFSQDAITENELENSITEALTEMLNQYDTAKYRTIKGDYSVYYQRPSDYDESTMDASETETETWYFDIDNNLKAYTREYVVRVGSSVNNPNSGSNIGENETTIYLFSNNSSEDPTIVGAYNNKNTNYDMAISTKERIVTSKCPKCGVSLDLGNNPTDFDSGTANPTDKVEVIEQKYVSGLSLNFLSRYSALLNWLKDVEVKKSDEDYTAKEELTHGETPYTVDYTIEKSLFEKLVKGNNQ
jgi:hypothetical protein